VCMRCFMLECSAVVDVVRTKTSAWFAAAAASAAVGACTINLV
jgi:hypothetical protein